MGCNQSSFKGIYNYPYQNEEKKDNETHVYRHPGNKEFKNEYPHNTLQSIMKNLFETVHSSRPVFQERIKDKDGNYGKETMTRSYGEYLKDFNNFGRGLLNLDLCQWHEEYKNFKLRFVGVYAKNSYKYFVEDMACLLYTSPSPRD